MSKHVLFDKDEVLERWNHEFTDGIESLDSLLIEARGALDALTAMQFHTESAPRRQKQDRILPTAADHAAADVVAEELAGRKRK